MVKIRDRILRVHAIDLVATTALAPLDVTHRNYRLDIDANELTAAFTVAVVKVMVYGEFVRTLCIYALARSEEHFNDGGWLSRKEAHQRWVAHGGNADSPEERIGWDRGKLRTQLSQHGFIKLKGLFEKKPLRKRCQYSPQPKPRAHQFHRLMRELT